MPPSVVLGLGSNLGAREDTLSRARAELEARGFRPQRESSLYLTEPVGGPPQDWYVNQVVLGETALNPEELLHACRNVEHAFGRVRSGYGSLILRSSSRRRVTGNHRRRLE